MKSRIQKYLNRLAESYYKNKFLTVVEKLPAGSHLVIVDIDNTIADTWPSLVNNTLRLRKRNRYLPVHKGMKEFVLKNFLSKSIPVVYLTARHIILTDITNKWLKKNEFISSNSTLVIVEHPQQKLYYLQNAIEKGIDITYIDDLSYNHENGEVKLYEELINSIKKLPVTYIGLEQINTINNGFQDT